jgi:hypothetical protein
MRQNRLLLSVYLLLQFDDFLLCQFNCFVQSVEVDVGLVFGLVELIAESLEVVFLLLHFGHGTHFFLNSSIPVILGEFLQALMPVLDLFQLLQSLTGLKQELCLDL